MGNVTCAVKTDQLRTQISLDPNPEAPSPARNPNRNAPGSVSGGGGPYLLGEGRGWQLLTFVSMLDTLGTSGQPNSHAVSGRGPGDETCAMRVDEDAEHSSEPSLVSTER